MFYFYLETYMQEKVNKPREVGIGFVYAVVAFFGYVILFAFGLVR